MLSGRRYGAVSIFEVCITHALISSQSMRHYFAVRNRDSMRDPAFVTRPRAGILAPSPSIHRGEPMTITQRSKEIDAMQKKALEANAAFPVNAAFPAKVSALRSALRSAPRKKGTRSRSPLKAAVVQLLPDLLAFRAKGEHAGAESSKM